MTVLVWISTILLSGSLGFVLGVIFCGTPDPNRRG